MEKEVSGVLKKEKEALLKELIQHRERIYDCTSILRLFPNALSPYMILLENTIATIKGELGLENYVGI